MFVMLFLLFVFNLMCWFFKKLHLCQLWPLLADKLKNKIFLKDAPRHFYKLDDTLTSCKKIRKLLHTVPEKNSGQTGKRKEVTSLNLHFVDPKKYHFFFSAFWLKDNRVIQNDRQLLQWRIQSELYFGT